jgi:GDP-L-fucose synthase
LKEDYLLTGILEETNEPYALAKIAGIKMCQAYNKQYGTRFISLMPTNLYGPGDNFDLETSHVLPALVRKFHEAKIKHKTQNQKEEPERVTIWGTGNPRREFLHVDDFADACIFLMNQYEDNQIINVGTGEDLSIKELAELIGDVVGFNGEIRNDPSKPDGTPQKLLDIGKLKALGWQSKISLREGIIQTYDWYVKNLQS